MRPVDLCAWELSFVERVLELRFELLGQVGHHNPQFALGESLAEADAVTSVEGDPAHGVTLFAGGCQTEGIAVVEPLWKELHGALPLSRALAQSF